jgi:hypothetical protein
MGKIEDWVYDVRSEREKSFKIGSYSLRKALSKQVTKVYIGTGIFTEFQRDSPQTIIKKSKSFKQKNFIRGFSIPDCPPD